MAQDRRMLHQDLSAVQKKGVGSREGGGREISHWKVLAYEIKAPFHCAQ